MNKLAVTIIDCGVGNIGSVANMIVKAGGTPRIVLEPDKLAEASKVVLCGVGAFDRGISSLTAGGWSEPLRSVVRSGVPLLGICLGLQMMCRDSEEGKLPGLGFFPARVRRIVPADPGLSVPHVGWSEVRVCRPNALFRQEDFPRFYFTHSFHAFCDRDEDVIATAEYGGPVTAAISRGNLFGTQFHPEKSHRYGLSLFTNFLRL